MPNVYDPTKKLFRNAQGYIPRAKVRAEIDKLIKHVQKQARKLARDYEQTGNIITFEQEMRDLLKSAHIVAASVGRGGRQRMTARDWGVVGAKIKWQYGYLAKFAAKVAKGTVQAISESRAASYASAVYTSYAKMDVQEQTVDPTRETVRLVLNAKESCAECSADAARGWVNFEDMKPLFTRLCGDFCRCHLEFSSGELDVPDITGIAMRVVFGDE